MEVCNVNKNILWVDIAKFIGIFFVILQHTFFSGLITNFDICYWINGLIQTFHMPLFFILMGYVFKQKDLNDNLNKIFWALVIPYFIYQFIFLPFRMGNFLFHHADFWITLQKCLTGIFIGDTGESNFHYEVCRPCWFIMTTIQLKLLFSVIKLNKKKVFIIMLISLILFELLRLFDINLYFCLDNTLMAIPYFLLGFIIKNYYNSILPIKSEFNLKYILCLFAGLSILLLCYQINGFIRMSDALTKILPSQSILVSYIGGLAGAFVVYKIASYFCNCNKFVNVISKNTLFIIFFHWLILFIGRWIHLPRLVPLIYTCLGVVGVCFACFLYAVINLTINYYTILFLSKYCPIMLGKYRPH